MRALAILVAAGCGGGSAAVDADVDVAMPGACDAPPLPFVFGNPTQVLRVGVGEAFATVEAAAAVATPGTMILLVSGQHVPDQFIDRLRGTAEAPIYIGGELPGPIRAIFTGGAEALHLSRPQYVLIGNIEVRGQTANGINIDDGGDAGDDTAAHHVSIARVHVHDVGSTGNQDCIKLSGVNDLAVIESRFSRCGGGAAGSGIDLVGSHRAVIARNAFDVMSGNAVQAKGGSTDVDIRQNRVNDGGERVFNLGGSTGLEFFRPPLVTSSGNAEARRIRAFNNIITGSTSAPFAFVGCVDCLVAHNTVVGNMRWLLRILQETESQGGFTFEAPSALRVINNSFVFSGAGLSTHVNVGGNVGQPFVTFDRNLWHATDAPERAQPVLPTPEVGSIVGMGSIYTTTPTDPLAPLPAPDCASGPEPHRGAGFAEIDGTIEGTCRTPNVAPTIGAQHCP